MEAAFLWKVYLVQWRVWMEGYDINQHYSGMCYKKGQVIQLWSFHCFMILDILFFFWFKASLNFQPKVHQLIVELIRQTDARSVHWFENSTWTIVRWLLNIVESIQFILPNMADYCHLIGLVSSFLRAMVDTFATEIASGMMRRDALKWLHSGREVVIWILVDTEKNK